MNVGELEIKYPTAKEDMPSPSPNVLTWSEVQQHYELSTQEQPAQGFHRGDEPAWQSWLDEHNAFAFVGQEGRISVLKEARSRGAGYWYAYRTQDHHTRKHYLGPTARLEAAAKELTGKLSSASFLWPDRRPFLHRRGLNPGAHPPRVQPHTS